jgi:hypothetical protein
VQLKEDTMLKQRYIPQGAVKVSDKLSDAVAYIYGPDSRPCARVFFGKQSKPVVACYYRNPLERALAVKRAFEGRRARAKMMAERKVEAQTAENTISVGDLFRASWGYDQTNINYYEVVAKTAKTVTVREIAQETTYNSAAMTGTCVPVPGNFLTRGGRASEPKVCRPGYRGSLKISDCQRAFPMKAQEPVPGVKVYETDSWSNGH